MIPRSSCYSFWIVVRLDFPDTNIDPNSTTRQQIAINFKLMTFENKIVYSP